MSACAEKCEAVIKAETKIEDLTGWQKSQNGAIHDVNKKVDQLLFWMMGQMAALVIAAITVYSKG